MRMLLCGLIGMVLLGACANPATPTSVASPVPGVLAVPATPDLARMPALATRATAVVASLQQPASTLRLPGFDTNAARAQDLALADRQVQPALRAPNGEPLRNEVFQSRPAGAGDLPPGMACARCYRVEIYQYATNSTLIILVDLDSGRVRRLNLAANGTLSLTITPFVYTLAPPSTAPQHLTFIFDQKQMVWQLVPSQAAQ